MESLSSVKASIRNADEQCAAHSLPPFSLALQTSALMVVQSDGPLNQYEALFSTSCLEPVAQEPSRLS
jgi:hypothetical protein